MVDLTMVLCEDCGMFYGTRVMHHHKLKVHGISVPPITWPHFLETGTERNAKGSWKPSQPPPGANNVSTEATG